MGSRAVASIWGPCEVNVQKLKDEEKSQGERYDVHQEEGRGYSRRNLNFILKTLQTSAQLAHTPSNLVDECFVFPYMLIVKSLPLSGARSGPHRRDEHAISIFHERKTSRTNIMN